MIYTAKIIGIFGGVAFILAFLPTLYLPEGVVESLASIISGAYKFNHVIDVDSMILLIKLTLTAELTLLIWRVFKWVLFLIK